MKTCAFFGHSEVRENIDFRLTNILIDLIENEDVSNFYVGNHGAFDRLVTDKTPPAFIWHTTEDDVVPVSNSILYANALARHGIPFDLHIYAHGRHGLSTVDAITCDELDPKSRLAAQWLPALKEWLRVTL